MTRPLVDADRIVRLMEGIGRRATGPGRVYLVGGSSAVLVGWRDATVDADIKLDPEPAAVFEAIALMKDELDMNVELAAPDQFVPPLPGWQERSPFIARYGEVDFFHYDFYGQALAKIERGHHTDLGDVQAMVGRGLIDLNVLLRLFEGVTRDLLRYPAIDEQALRAKLAAMVERAQGNAQGD